MNEQELRDELLASVPEPPSDAAVWSEGARRRSQRDHRRRLLAGGLTSVVLVAGGVAGTLGIRQNQPVVPAQPSTRAMIDCAALPASATSGRALPDGAVAAALCPAETDHDSSPQVGTEELVTGVDELVGQFNALPRAPRSRACTAMGGISYRMVFRYSDGGLVVIPGSLGDCRDVGGREGGAEALLTGFTMRLGAQRTTQAPPLREVADPCTAGASYLPADREHLVKARICPDSGASIRLDDKALALLRQDLKAARPGQGGTRTTNITVVDAYGQPLTLFWEGAAVNVGFQAPAYSLSPETVTALEAAMAGWAEPQVQVLCRMRSSASVDPVQLSRGAVCGAKPRLLRDSTVGSLGKLIGVEGVDGDLPRKGPQTRVVLATGKDGALEVAWVGNHLLWTDPTTGKPKHLEIPDYLTEDFRER